MSSHPQTYRFWGIFIGLMLVFLSVEAQERMTEKSVPQAFLRREGNVRTSSDSLSVDSVMPTKTLETGEIDSIQPKQEVFILSDVDTITQKIFDTADSLINLGNGKLREQFVPNPKKALWLSIVFPGGGQIYNRKYWKLPLVYGGFLGCVYAMTWNNTMYRDYSQAYIDIMDSDDTTKSYENFLPPNYDANANKTRLQEVFKRKKNYYRRYRDLSMFCMIGVYALSIIDAYVDAELSSFDISDDLSMRVRPAVIKEQYSTMKNQGLNTCSYGLQCSLNF